MTLRKRAAAVALMLCAAGPAMAQEPAWWEPAVCPEMDPHAPGGSRETARKVDLGDFFIELDDVADTDENFKFSDAGLPPPLPRETLAPNCQWVEFEGYFRPVRYHDFRGQMLESIADHYLTGAPVAMLAPHFWVQNWADPDVSSYALHNRRLRIKARVYDQCLALLQYELQRGELGIRLGSACHYGENNGMVLTDAEVVETLSPEKIIARLPDLSDVLGQPARLAKLRYPPVIYMPFEPLIAVENLPSEPSRIVRQWLRRVKTGPDAEIESETRKNGPLEENRVASIRKLHAHPDGRYGYLNAQPGFAALDPDKAEIRFFASTPFGEWTDAPRRWRGYGCVGISPAVSWPVAEIDADFAIASFACTSISLWSNDEWDGGY